MGAGPRLIVVAGASCSGKTTLARAVAEALGPTAARVLSMDRYYRDLSEVPLGERGTRNFDHPDALDHALLVEQVAALLDGTAIEAPVYDFKVHARRVLGERIEAPDCLVLEGLQALYWEPIRRLARTAVFVELDDEVCLARRIERDMRERGRTEESVRDQYAQTVRPMFEEYVLPARAFAHLVVAGDRGLEETVRDILRHFEGLGPA